MEENNLENDTLLNESEKDNSITPEVEETKDNSLKITTAQKEHYREKAQKLEAQLKELQSKIPTAPQASNQDPIEIVKLTKALEGRTEDEVQFILRNAKGKTAQDIIDASKDEWVNAAIEAKREKLQKDNKIPSPSNPMSSDFEPKGFLDIKSMSDEQFEAYQKGLFERANRKKSGERI
jgi:hypothetical protein